MNVRPRVLRRNLFLAGLGGVIAAASITTGVAKADSGDLVAWAYSNGFTGSPAVIATRGALVCADLASGFNGEQAAVDLWLNTGIVALVDAQRFVIASVEQLCPEYDHRTPAGEAYIA